jgi:hypothetical protein
LTQSCGDGQSFEAEHSAWHSPKLQTRLESQSLLSLQTWFSSGTDELSLLHPTNKASPRSKPMPVFWSQEERGIKVLDAGIRVYLNRVKKLFSQLAGGFASKAMGS